MFIVEMYLDGHYSLIAVDIRRRKELIKGGCDANDLHERCHSHLMASSTSILFT